MFHELPIINWAASPNSGVYVAKYSEFATNDVWDRNVLVFTDTATRIPLHGGFRVPLNYVGTPSLVGVWTCLPTTGNVVWDFDYRAVALGESFDQTGVQEAVTVTQAAPGSVNLFMGFDIGLTAGNFVVGDEVEFAMFRDGAAADTIAGSVLMLGLYFKYVD